MSVVVLSVTGGPCGGKTTVLERVRKHFGNQVLVMPEVPSILLENGFPRPGSDVDFGERWLYAFQHSVFPVQLNMEQEYRIMAGRGIARVLICDRGLMDGAAYCGKGVTSFLDMFSMKLEDVLGRYDQVIHLESVAVSSRALYEQLKSTNPARYEDADQAAAMDMALRSVWQDHPNWTLVESADGITQVVNQVIAIISSYLTVEIEVKYRLNALPPRALLGSPVPIQQGYLPITSGELRVRKMGSEHYLTIKGDGLVSRSECERAIDPWAFDLLYPETVGQRIEKLRYFIPHNGHTLEIDVYSGCLDGLVTLECELPTVEDADAFTLPEWAAGAVNVTKNTAYKNRTLAQLGLPTT